MFSTFCLQIELAEVTRYLIYNKRSAISFSDFHHYSTLHHRHRDIEHSITLYIS